MKRALIYIGGAIEPSRITEQPKENDLVLAADAGLANAAALGVTPSAVLGDFDSLGSCEIPKGVEIHKVPAEKDFTDTQLAVDIAVKQGAQEILLIGGLSGRLDHTLSNLSILEDLCEKGIYATITDGNNRVRYLKSTSTLLPKSGFRYLSLLCLSPQAKGVSVEGCKYPLKNATLKRKFQYAVSNEITGNCALVSVRKGGLYLIESIDCL